MSEVIPGHPWRLGLLRQVAFGGTRLLILITAVAGMMGGLLASWMWRVGHGVLMLGLALAAVGLGAAVFVWIARSTEPQSHRPFAILLAFILITRLLYVFAVDQPLFSDFRVMWDYAHSVATDGYHSPSADPIIALQQLRALPVLVPVAVLSGGSPVGYKLANVVFLAGCTLLVYWLASTLVGRKAALLSAWLVAIAPEPLMAAAIPSHDIAGTFLGLLSLALLVRLQRSSLSPTTSWAPAIGISVLLGVSLFLADLQRGLGLFLLAAFAASAVLLAVEAERWRSAWRLAVLCVGLPVVVSGVCGRLVRQRAEAPEARRMADRSSWRYLAIYGNSDSDGNSGYEAELGPMILQLSDSDLHDFAIARSMSDLVDGPVARAANYSKRIAGLHHLGDQYHFYLSDTTWGKRWIPTPMLPARAGEQVALFMRSYSDVFRVAFLALALLAMLNLVFLSECPGEIYGPVLFTSFLTLGLGLFGSLQARYLFPLWFIAPIYVGHLFAQAGSSQVPRRIVLRRAVSSVALALGLTVVATLAVVFAWEIGGVAWTGRLAEASTLARHGRVLIRGRYELDLVPSPDTAAQVTLSLEGRRARSYSLNVFLSPGAGSQPHCRTRTTVLVDGELRDRGEILSGSPPRLLRVDDIRGSAGPARVTLQADTVKGDPPCAAAVSFPWVKAGRPAT